MEFEYYTLENGIRLIHYPVKSKVAHLGLFINAGTRDELPGEEGIAHFIEHMIFKGTKKRKAYHILSRLEDVGGELDAYTTKEETCISAAFLSEYYERSIELFSDIILNSVFPEKEIEKEKDVVIDEINSYKDSPSEQIFDDFESFVFAGHPLGNNILGTEERVLTYTGRQIMQFVKRNYVGKNMIVASVGNVSKDYLSALLNKYFNQVSTGVSVENRRAFTGYKQQRKKEIFDTFQAHCITGIPAYNASHKNRLGLILLNNLLAGPGMNSRLNMALREKYGYTYNIESNYTPYTDSGLFNIYFGTDKDKVQKSLTIIEKELKRLKENQLGVLQLSRAKKQLAGQLAISFENNSGLMHGMGKSLLLYDSVESVETIFKKIDALTSSELLSISNEILDMSRFSTLVFE